MDRRRFVRTSALLGAGMALSAGAVIKDRLSPPPKDPGGEETVRNLSGLEKIAPREGEDPLLRMQRELARAMAKPVEKRRWVMVIDTRKCVGCQACTIGCVAENKLPPGVVYRPVIQEEFGSFPNVKLRFTPRPCMHCDRPPCVVVCPVKATWKRPDGVVVVHYDKCIGCRYCLTACPYGARTSDFGLFYSSGVAEGAPAAADGPVFGPDVPYESAPSHEYGKRWDRRRHGSPIGNARKCHFCLHRLEKGLLPVCVTTCIGRATFFGDAADTKSLVTELTTKNNVQTLLAHKATEPRVFYIF